jgi:hypothetical protein
MSAITMHLRSGVTTAPLRVDLAGGWLDLPKFARPGAFIANCAIKPLVSRASWHYQPRSGLGGSATYALLCGKNPLASELGAGVGWQDPAIILETGLCVWRSGRTPVLHAKINPDWLKGLMALYWTGKHHDTAGLVRQPRDFELIVAAGAQAAKAALRYSLPGLQRAIQLSYKAQMAEGMSPLPKVRGAAAKYCGSGWGGYALYLFNEPGLRDHFLEEPGTLAIEPYLRDWPA